MATEFRLMNSLRPSSPLRLRPYSDLHLEFGVDDTFLSCLSDDGADIVVLAGDVHRGDKGVQWAIERFACPVVYVLGNHEPYGHDLDDSIASCRDSARGSNVVVLENEEVVFGGVRFLGCTFWTDFASNGAERVENAKTTARSLLPDFEVISQSNHPLTPDDVICRHGQSKSWLNARLATPFPGRTVVVTHFPAHADALHGGHPADSDLRAYFSPEVPELFSHEIDVWISGHTHWSFQSTAGPTRLISNQGGFPGVSEPGEPQAFQPDLIVEI